MLDSYTGKGPFNFFTKSGNLFFIFSICFAFWLGDLWRPYNYLKGHSNFVWDMFGYYSYLPATFLNHGSFSFAESVQNFNPQLPSGEFMPKYTYGVSVLQLPFFLLAALTAKLQGDVGSGFTNIYCVFQEAGSLIYVLIGLFLIRKILLQYYREFSVTLAMFIVLFGTIVFMYTFIQAEMSHAYVFFLFSVLIFYTHKFYLNHRFLYLLPVAASWALITVIRPTEIITLAFFIFWQVYNLAQAKQRFIFLSKNYKIILLLVGALIVAWLPQLFFWKAHTGRFWFDSYVDEHFFWFDPQIINVLFSYRKGLFVYTPATFLALVGLLIIKRKSPFSIWLYVVFFMFSTYIYSCWWTWDFGGCFGARSFTHHFVYLLFPLTALINKVTNTNETFVLQRLATWLIYTASFSVVCLNLGQSYQYQVQRNIDPIGMSEALYWETFTKYQFNDNFKNKTYWKYLRGNDSENWRKGINRSDK